MAEWTLVEMCCILRPPKAESVREIYSSSVRQKGTKSLEITRRKEATEAANGDEKNAKAAQHGPKGDPPLGDKDGNSQGRKSTPVLNLQFPNDLTEKLEKLVGMMQADKSCDPAELMQ